MTYATLADVKLYLDLATNTNDDASLLLFIDKAQGIIDSYCNRTFEADADTTRYFDAVHDVDYPQSLILFLDHDLASVTSITNGDGTAVTANQYVMNPRNRTPYYAIELLPSSGIAWTYTTDWQNAIAITGRWAYATSAPQAIIQTCVRLAVWLYRQKDTSADSNAERPIMTASGTVIMPSSLPRDIRDILEPYRRKSVG